MPLIELIDTLIVLLAGILGLVFFAYTFYICKNVVPKVDYHLNGWNYESSFWIRDVLRANEYTTYSLLPSRAKKAGVYERYNELDPWIRRHFLIWMGLAFITVLLMVTDAILIYFFPELG